MSLPTFKRGDRVVGDTRDQLRAYAQDKYTVQRMTVRQVAEHIGRSYGFTQTLLTEAGVLRPRGGNMRKASS